MTATTKAEIEKVVRKVLDEEQGDAEVSLKAMQRLSRLLAEEVIPQLADRAGAEGLDMGQPAPCLAATRSRRNGETDPEGTPDGEMLEGSPDAPEVMPSAALAVLGQLYAELSAEQAAALASFFTGLVNQTAEEDERPSPLALSSGRVERPGARAIKVRPGVKIGPTGKLLIRLLESYPKKHEIYITSAYRPQDAGSHHGGLTYRGSPTAAIDIGGGGVNPVGSRRMRDMAKWLYDRFAGDTVELIHTTPYNTDNGFYVKNQRKYPGGGPYGPKTREQHRDHVHFATSKALAQKILGRLGNRQALVQTAAPVWGWDASGHDWQRGPMQLAAAKRDGISFFTHKCSEGGDFRVEKYQEGLERARRAGIPVLGAYHVLWPGKPIEEARFFFNEVNTKTPWWQDVPWIWQLDAEKFDNMPRPPSPAEGKKFLDELKRLARGQGYFIAYAPRWLYKDSFNIGYDLWASDYRGSGAPRSFKEQYKGVPASSWRPYSGRKPRILQFSSDARIGTQKTCDANRFDGDLPALIKLTGRQPADASPTNDTSDRSSRRLPVHARSAAQRAQTSRSAAERMGAETRSTAKHLEVNMTATTQSEIAKVVRTVLDEEQGDTNAATLRAIQRVTALVREQVIPKLSDAPRAAEPDADDETCGAVFEADASSADPFAPDAAARAYPYQPCRKGGPTRADHTVAAQIKPKLRGTLRQALNGQRICCARQVVGAVKARRLPKRAAVIAVTTTIVESTLLNINKESDHDSLGLFQQRASWGSRQNRLNPTWATNAFLNAMLRKFPGNSWLTQPIGKVCQRVQVSAYPGRYQPQAADAAIIVGALWSAGQAPSMEGQSATHDATWQAIQRVSALLTEQVIPRLSDAPDAQQPDMGDEPHDATPDATALPDMPDEDTSPDQDVPAAVTAAVTALYQRLSAREAAALARLLTTVSNELAEDSEVEQLSR